MRQRHTYLPRAETRETMSDVHGLAAPGTFCQSQSAHPAQECCCANLARFQKRAWGVLSDRQHSAATTRRLTHRASPLRPLKRQLPSVGQAASWSSCTAPACGLTGRRNVCLPLPSTARGPHIPPPRMPLPLQVQTFPWQPPTRTNTSPPRLQPVAASKAGWSEQVHA